MSASVVAIRKTSTRPRALPRVLSGRCLPRGAWRDGLEAGSGLPRGVGGPRARGRQHRSERSVGLPPRRDRERALARASGRTSSRAPPRTTGRSARERSWACRSAPTTSLPYGSTAARASPHSSSSSRSSFRSSLLLSIDQGTTGTTCLVVDEELRPRGRGYREVEQHFPRSGWVEHDPEELWESVLASAAEALADAGIAASELQGIGITNQRETTIVWERAPGGLSTGRSSGRTAARRSAARSCRAS